MCRRAKWSRMGRYKRHGRIGCVTQRNKSNVHSLAEAPCCLVNIEFLLVFHGVFSCLSFTYFCKIRKSTFFFPLLSFPCKPSRSFPSKRHRIKTRHSAVTSAALLIFYASLRIQETIVKAAIRTIPAPPDPRTITHPLC